MRPIGSEWAFRILRRNSCPYPWRKKEIFSKNKLAGGIHSHQTGDFFRGFPASVRALKEKPHQIKRVIKASTKASGYIRQNREGTLPVMIKWLKIDRDIASMTYDSVWKAFTEDGSLPKTGCGSPSKRQSTSAKLIGMFPPSCGSVDPSRSAKRTRD